MRSLYERAVQGLSKTTVYAGLTLAAAADWLVVIVLHFVCDSEAPLLAESDSGGLLDVEKSVKPHQQDITEYLEDPAYRFPHVTEQHVPTRLLFAITYWMPLAFIIVVGAARESLVEVHYGVLSYLAGYNFTWLSTEFVKLQVGRLRPDFFDRCQFDKVTQSCTGVAWLVQDGRKSFPSGHSSGACFAGAFLFLFISGKNGALAFNHVGHGWTSAKLPNLFVSFVPLGMAIFIAVSRWQDHIHHPTDIMAGSLLGTLEALIFYHVFWPTPWSSSNVEERSRPRVDTVSAQERQAHVEQGERQPLLS